MKPGRRASHIREDTNIEPVFMHSLSRKFHEELIHSLCIHAMVDGTLAVELLQSPAFANASPTWVCASRTATKSSSCNT